MHFINSSFTFNNATEGSGLMSITGTTTMTAGSFSDNFGSSSGGAIKSLDSDVMNLDGVSFVNNTSGEGGCIYAQTAILNLVNSLLLQNTQTP